MATVAASEEGMTAAPQDGQKRLGAVSSVAQEGQRSMGKPWIYCIKIIVGQAVGQAIAFRGLSCFAEAQTLGVGRPILAAAGFSRLPVLPSPATSRLPHFFMRFRGPKALCNRRQKPIICSTFDARPTFDSHVRGATGVVADRDSPNSVPRSAESHLSALSSESAAHPGDPSFACVLASHGSRWRLRSTTRN